MRSRVRPIEATTAMMMFACQRMRRETKTHHNATHHSANGARRMRERAGWAFAYVTGVAFGVAAACAARSDAGARARVKVSMVIDGLIQRATTRAPVDDDTSGDAEDEDDARDAPCDPGLRAAFERAANGFKMRAREVPDGVALELYALYAIATKRASVLRNAREPSAFDVIAKAKYDAVKTKMHLSSSEAKSLYVATFEMWERAERNADAKRAEAPRDANGHTAEDHAAVEEFNSTTCDDRYRSDGGDLFDAWSQGAQSRPMAAAREDEDDGGDCALSAACRDGDEDAAVHRMTNGSDVNERDASGRTPLHWCADAGHAKIALQLIVLGADIDARDASGQTPLHYATICERVDVCKLLVRSGADTTIADEAGETAESLGLFNIVSSSGEFDSSEDDDK